jgi:site-specific DNA recombinase
LKKEIIELQHENVVNIYTEQEIEKKIELLKQKWNSGLSDSEMNTLLKSIVKKIYYDRDMDNITFEVEYL